VRAAAIDADDNGSAKRDKTHRPPPPPPHKKRQEVAHSIHLSALNGAWNHMAWSSDVISCGGGGGGWGGGGGGIGRALFEAGQGLAE
jgi:hypothetical protein